MMVDEWQEVKTTKYCGSFILEGCKHCMYFPLILFNELKWEISVYTASPPPASRESPAGYMKPSWENLSKGFRFKHIQKFSSNTEHLG